eukprot:719622-Prymnesium_polylepis.1
MPPPPKNARPASEGTSVHARRRHPSQADRLQLRSLFLVQGDLEMCERVCYGPTGREMEGYPFERELAAAGVT